MSRADDACAEAERIISNEMHAEAITGALPFKTGFVEGAEWQASRPITHEQVEAVARAAYIAQYQDKSWAAMAWDDMGGSEPADERANIEIAIRAALEAAR